MHGDGMAPADALIQDRTLLDHNARRASTRRPKTVRWFVIVGLLLAVVLGGLYGFNRFRAHAQATNAARRRDRSQNRLRELVSQRVMSRLERSAWGQGELASMVDRVAARDIDPYTAAEQLVEKAFA